MVGLRPPVALWLLKLHDLQASSSATPEASSGPGTTVRKSASSEPAEDFHSNHVPAISADQAKGEAGETGDVSRHERTGEKIANVRMPPGPRLTRVKAAAMMWLRVRLTRRARGRHDPW